MSYKLTGPPNGSWQLHAAGRCLQCLFQSCFLFQRVPVLGSSNILGNLSQGKAEAKGWEDASQDLKFNLIKNMSLVVGYQALWTRQIAPILSSLQWLWYKCKL